MPGGLSHADIANKLVPTLVPQQLLGGARVGRCHGLLEELALAFAMGTHERLVAGSAAAGGGGPPARRWLRREQGKAPAAEREEEGCPYLMMPADLVKEWWRRAGGGQRASWGRGWCG